MITCGGCIGGAGAPVMHRETYIPFGGPAGGRGGRVCFDVKCSQALVDAGWQEMWRALHPDTQEFSWWDYRGGAFHRKQGLRIDFVLGTPAVAESLKDVVIDRDYRKKQDGMTASDHAPVVAELS